MNRRDLLLLGTNRRARSVELSCEGLYMRFCDAHLDNSRQELLDRLKGELQGVKELRLADCTWLAREDYKQWLEPLLASVRTSGGRVVFESSAALP